MQPCMCGVAQTSARSHACCWTTAWLHTLGAPSLYTAAPVSSGPGHGNQRLVTDWIDPADAGFQQHLHMGFGVLPLSRDDCDDPNYKTSPDPTQPLNPEF